MIQNKSLWIEQKELRFHNSKLMTPFQKKKKHMFQMETSNKRILTRVPSKRRISIENNQNFDYFSHKTSTNTGNALYFSKR